MHTDFFDVYMVFAKTTWYDCNDSTWNNENKKSTNPLPV